MISIRHGLLYENLIKKFDKRSAVKIQEQFCYKIGIEAMLSSLGMFITDERSRTRQFHYGRLIHDFTPILDKPFLCKINIFFSGDNVCTCAELLAADHLILL